MQGIRVVGPLALTILIGACIPTGAPSGTVCKESEYRGYFETPQGAVIASYAVQDGNALVGGDMLFSLSDFEFTAASRVGAKMWPQGADGVHELAYTVEAGFGKPEQVQRAVAAINSLTAQTNIRMVERTNQTDYAEFTDKEEGCFAFVGRRGGGRQPINLDGNCPPHAYEHEIFHTMCLGHEHQRSDRDQYVRVDYEAMDTRIRRSWDIMENMTLVTQYDVRSIMHYGAGAGIDKQKCTQGTNGNLQCNPVMSSKEGVPLGEVGGKSIQNSDIRGIASCYGGSGPVPGQAPPPRPSGPTNPGTGGTADPGTLPECSYF